MRPLKNLVVLLWVIAPLTVFGATPQPTPAADESVDLNQVETFLKKSKKDRWVEQERKIEEVEKNIKSALYDETSLVGAYRDAYAAVNFDGGAKDYVKVKDWCEKNRSNLSDDCFVWVLKGHVLYLQATIAKKQGNDEKAIKLFQEWLDRFPKKESEYDQFRKHDSFPRQGVSTTTTILNSVAKSGVERYKNFVRQDLFSAGMSRSLFLRSENAVFIAEGLSNWYVGDLSNYPESHRVNVIGYYREKKDLKILAEWDRNLKLEQHLSEFEGLEQKKKDFVEYRKPPLVLAMAKDYAAFGKHKQAIKMLMNLLEENPDCKEYWDIVAEIRRMTAVAKKK